MPFTIKNIAGLNAIAKTRNMKASFIEKQIKTIEHLFDYCLFYLDLFTLSIKLKWGTQKAYISKVKKLNHRS